jgi:hypothetical protein
VLGCHWAIENQSLMGVSKPASECYHLYTLSVVITQAF